MDSDTEEFEDVPTTELLPKIIVRAPVTHDTWEHGKFTTYQICLKTDHPAFHLPVSVVRRRFSEVRWLYTVLKKIHQHIAFPAPPPKKMLAERFDVDFINTRMKGIENFLNDLLMIDTILSDAAFHLFLQTDLTTEEIDEYFTGSLSEEIVESAWKNAGHLHTSSFSFSAASIPYEPREIVMNEEDVQYYNRPSRRAGDSSSQSSISEDHSPQASGASGPASPPAVLKVNSFADVSAAGSVNGDNLRVISCSGGSLAGGHLDGGFMELKTPVKND